MIDNLKPYPEYKESGLPWVGAMPAHWSQRRTKFLFQERVQKGFPKEPLLAATQTKGVIRKEDYGTRTVTAMKDLHLLKLVEKGDFVISLRSFEGGIEIAHCRGIISPAYTVLTPRSEAVPSYYAKFFKSASFIRSLTLFVTGIREGQNIDYERVGRAYMPFPPKEEQKLIGSFLLHVNRRVDQAIRSKRKLIAFLNEQKQAIIQKAVTRGLDPNVPLKDSGIPWLGQIPAHWEIIRGDHLFATSKQLAFPEDIQLSATQAYGVISQEEYEARIGRRIVKINMHLEKRKHVEKDDFVMSMRSFQGGLERAWQSGAIRSSYVILRPSSKVEPSYFMYLLKSSGYIRALQSTGNFIRDGQDLTEDNFRAVPLPIFSTEEQRAIGVFIRSQTEGISKQVQIGEREIDLLREYRTRLVSDVVTGKLDVRAAAANLPPEVDESDSVAENEDLDELDDEVVEEAA